MCNTTDRGTLETIDQKVKTYQPITHPTVEILEAVDRYFHNNGYTVYCVYDETDNRLYWAIKNYNDSNKGMTFDNFTQVYDYYMYCMKHGFRLYTISEITQ